MKDNRMAAPQTLSMLGKLLVESIVWASKDRVSKLNLFSRISYAHMEDTFYYLSYTMLSYYSSTSQHLYNGKD